MSAPDLNVKYIAHLARLELTPAEEQKFGEQLGHILEHIEKLKQSMITKILSLHEAAKVAKDVLETTRKPGGTRNFAVIQGYIPDQMEKKFKNLTKNYVSVVEDAHAHADRHGEEVLPSGHPKIVVSRPSLPDPAALRAMLRELARAFADSLLQRTVGLGQRLCGTFVLQLGWLSYYEYVLWAVLFWQGAGLNAAGQGEIEILYDERCNLCDRTVRLLSRVDLFGVVSFRPLGRDQELLSKRGISAGDALQDLYGIDRRGRVFRGYDLYAELETKEAGIADTAECLPIDRKLKPLADAVRANPWFKDSFDNLPVSFRLVELNKLVVSQVHVERSFTDSLGASLEDALRAATTAPAQVLRLPASGRLAVGLPADVVASLDASGEAWRTQGSHALIQSTPGS